MCLETLQVHLCLLCACSALFCEYSRNRSSDILYLRPCYRSGLSKNFCEVVCKNICGGGINLWPHVLTCTCTFLLLVPAYVHRSLPKKLLLRVVNMSFSFKFHTDLIFPCGDICKNWAGLFLAPTVFFLLFPIFHLLLSVPYGRMGQFHVLSSQRTSRAEVVQLLLILGRFKYYVLWFFLYKFNSFYCVLFYFISFHFLMYQNRSFFSISLWPPFTDEVKALTHGCIFFTTSCRYAFYIKNLLRENWHTRLNLYTHIVKLQVKSLD